jgi:hypothetical protein
MATLGLVTAGSLRSASAQGNPTIFATFGDIPYNAPVDNYPTRNGKYEMDDRVLKQFIIPTLKSRSDIPFLIHTGDTGRPEVACRPANFQKTVDSWKKLAEPPLPKPAFYTPGDNDWTDCDRESVKPPVGPLSALEVIRYLAFDGWGDHRAPGLGNWQQAVPGLSMPEYRGMVYDHLNGANFAKYPENWMWRYDDIVFATVHEVSSDNGWVKTGDPGWQIRQAEVKQRDVNNIQWVKQIEYYAIEEKANAVVIAMHADPFEEPPREGFCKPPYETCVFDCRRSERTGGGIRHLYPFCWCIRTPINIASTNHGGKLACGA